jgi:hypothetical protein
MVNAVVELKSRAAQEKLAMEGKVGRAALHDRHLGPMYHCTNFTKIHFKLP